MLERCLRLCSSLGFIPLPHVGHELNRLIAAPPTQALVQQYPRLQEFFDYIINTYINGNYPPDTWNVFNRGIDTRTNNYVESYFGRWNKSMGATHPSLWTVILKLKDEHSIPNWRGCAAQNWPQKISDEKYVKKTPLQGQLWSISYPYTVRKCEICTYMEKFIYMLNYIPLQGLLGVWKHTLKGRTYRIQDILNAPPQVYPPTQAHTSHLHPHP